MANSAKTKPVLQLGMTLLIIGSVLFACEKSALTPSESSTSSARSTDSTDTSDTTKDSLCHKRDSIHHHLDSLFHHPQGDSLHHFYKDSLHHFYPDSLHRPDTTGIPHDSVHPHHHGKH